MEEINLMIFNQNKSQNEVDECYSELFDLKSLESIIKGEDNGIELYNCFFCTKQNEYICKWCKENYHGKKYHQNNGEYNVEIQKMTKSRLKKISNFTCICKQQNHDVKKNTSYNNLYGIIKEFTNFESNNFYDSMNRIIKLMIKNKDYEEFLDLLFFLKNSEIQFHKIIEYNDEIWKDLIILKNEKIKIQIISLYFEFYIHKYFIVNDGSNSINKNILFLLHNKLFNNNIIIYNYYIYDIINIKNIIYNKLCTIEPILFLKKNNFYNDLFEYLMKSDYIFDSKNYDFLLWNLFIKDSYIKTTDNNYKEKMNILLSNNIYNEESKFILLKIFSDLEVFEDFICSGFTKNIPFININNNIIKVLLLNIYKDNNNNFYKCIINMFSNNKYMDYNNSYYNKDKILFILYYYSNKKNFENLLALNKYIFDVNNLLTIIDDFIIELNKENNKIEVKSSLYSKIERFFIEVNNCHNHKEINEEVFDNFLIKSIQLINLIIKDEGKYYFINSYFLTIILKFILNDLALKKENHLNIYFSIIDILKLLPKREIELRIKTIINNEISKHNYKNENLSLLYYLLINPEIEDISFLKPEKYENLLNEMCNFYLKIFEIKRINSLIKYFEDFNVTIPINELIKIIVNKNIINENDKFFVFSLSKFKNEENKILEEEINDMNKNDNISDIYILYFIKSVLSLENRCIYLNQNMYIKFDEFFNCNNNNLRQKTYNNLEIIKNEKIPFCIKTLLLKLILKIGLTLKIDKYNTIYRPLTNKQEMIRKKIIKMDILSSQEKINFPYNEFNKDDDLIYISIGDKIYNEHFLVIMNIINILKAAIEILAQIKFSENNNNIPEGIYYYSIIILKGLYYISNMILNSYDIYYLYYKNFEQIVNIFYENEIIFLKIFKINNENIELTNKYECYLTKFRLTLKKYSDLINEKNCISIYDEFYKDNNESLFTKKEDNFLVFFQYYFDNCVTLEELNIYSPNNRNKNSKIFDNYMNWVKYNSSIKDSDIIKILTSINIKDKDMELNLLNKFIEKFYISILNSNSFYILEYNELYLFIKLFKFNKDYINYGINSELSIKTDNVNKNIQKEKIPVAFIGKLIKSINYYCYYEISISNSFSNTKNENFISRYVNALIILLTVVSDNFDEYIVNYNYDFTNNDCFDSLEVKKEESFYNTICSPYECMIILYQKIYESLIANYFYKDENLRPNHNNLLILFYTITNFLISFSPIKLEKHKNKISILLNTFFKIHLNQNILKFIDDHSLYENKENFKYNSDTLFIKNQLIKLFVTFIQLNKEKILFQSYLNKYKYEITLFMICDLLKIIEKIIQLNEKKESIISYKQNQILYDNDSNLFYDFLKKLFENASIIHFTDYSSLIFLYYKTIRILIYDYNYSMCKVLLDDKNNNENEFYETTPIFFQSILKILNIKGFFKFLNSIYIEIDYRYYYEKNIRQLNENSAYIVKTHSFFMHPNYSKLSIYFKEIFLDKVNRTSRLHKMNFLNYFIDTAVYDCVYRKNKIQLNKNNMYFIDINFKILEHLNVFFVTIENIYLLIIYHKDIDSPIDQYNFIDKEKYVNFRNSHLWIIVFFHSLYLGGVLLLWGYLYFYRYYFHCLRQLSESKKFLIKKVSLDKKSLLFGKMFKNENDFKNIKFRKFYPYFTTKNYIFLAVKELFLLNHKSWALYTFIFTLCYFISSPFTLVVSWIYIGNFFPNLLNVFRSLKNNFLLIFSVYFYSYVLVYILTWASFFFIPQFFTIQVTDKDNNIIEQPEAQCSSSFSCLLFFLNHAMPNGGFVHSNQVSFKRNVNIYLTKFFIEVIFFQLINWIFTNLFLALVTNSFEAVYRKTKKNTYDKNTKCFICEINYKKCFSNNINFKEHCQIKHSIWNYIYFIVQIIIKDEYELNHCEKYIYNFIKNDDFNWLPYEGDDLAEKYISPLISKYYDSRF